MRKTKIVCTIGPACANENTLREMCLAGMNVARLNFSHGTHEEHLKVINMIKISPNNPAEFGFDFADMFFNFKFEVKNA